MARKKAEAEVDFNALVGETRARMQEKAASSKKIGRKKAVEKLTYRSGDFVSYRYAEGANTRYIAAVFLGEADGRYELKLSPHSGIEVGADGTLWADPEEVTPRVLRPITNFAPLAVGDRVEREVCASDEQVPLKGVCAVVMCSDDMVTIADQAGARWEGAADNRLALRGRASLLAALADLGYTEAEGQFVPGQQVVVDDPLHGRLEGEVTQVEASTAFPERQIVYGTSGEVEFKVFSDRVQPLEGGVGVAPPPELPGTPVLLPASGVQMISWEDIVPSPLNPRKKFDEIALRELAIDIERKGVLQNLVARPHSTRTGYYEIAAGERRHRAVGLLVQGFEENGVRHQVPADFQVPVLVRELSDRELLEVATAENVQRRRMTPMEEAEAFAAIAAQGATPAEIAHKFGYAERTVTRRIQIAQNLSDALKEAFDQGEVTLEKAEILALAPKKQQKALLDSVRYYSGTAVAELRKAISKQAFQVEHALFDPSLYSGEIVEDLFGDVPAYFQDAKQAADLQTEHLEGLAKEAEAAGAAFAQVVVHGGAYFNGNFEFPPREGGTGQVWIMDTRTGKVEHLTGRVRRADQQAERAAVQQPDFGWQNRNLSKKLRDEAVGAALYAHPRLTQAAFVASQILGYSDFGVEQPSPDMLSACARVAEVSGGVLEVPTTLHEGMLVAGRLPLTDEERAEIEAEADGEPVDWEEVDRDVYPEGAVLAALLDLPDDLLTQLVVIGMLDAACHTELMDELAHRTGASIAGKVEITGAFLKAMNRPALAEVAVEAGFELDDIKDDSDEEIRIQLLEVAGDLKAEGFVPSFMDFERPDQDQDDAD